MKGALARANRGSRPSPEGEPVIAVIGDDGGGPSVSPGPMRRMPRVPAALRAGAPAWTWVGTLVAAAGFALIAVGWGQVATEVDVYRQIPYVVSAGLVGLGLVLVGLAVLNIASRQRDAIERDRQIDQLVQVIEELKVTLSTREPRS